MANQGYPTGVSRQPIDFVSGAQNYLQSAVEQKLADIDANRIQIEEGEKDKLKAMSIKTISGLTRGLQKKYSKEIADYKKRITDRYVAKGNVLSDEEEMEVQQEYDDIVARQMADVSALKQRETARKITNDPNFQYGFNADSALAELSRWDKAMEKGEYLGDPSALILKHRISPSPSQIATKEFGDQIKRMDIGSKGKWIDENTFEFTTREDEEEVQSAIDAWMERPNIKSKYTARDGVVFEDKKEQVRQELYDTAVKSVKDLKTYNPSSGRGRSGSQLKALSPKTVKVASGEYSNYVDYPASQGEKRFTVNKAFNEETGKEDNFDKASSMRVIGFDAPANKVFFVAEGGELKKGGNKLYGLEGKITNDSSMEKKKKSGMTEDEIMDDILKVLAQKSKFAQSDKATRVQNPDIVENDDGSITVTGTVEKWRKKGLLGINKGMVKEGELDTKKHVLDDKEKVSVTFNPLNDPKSSTRYSLPLDQYEEVVSELTSYGVGDQKVYDYYKGSQKGEKASKDITQAEYSKLKKGDTYWFKGKQYTKE